MRKALITVIGATLLGISFTAIADDSMMMKHDQMMMKEMDANGDGKISKEEYMAYYEKKWEGMKKDSSGMMDAKAMMMMHHDGMMKDKGMSQDSMSH